jgi:hypothetical protein
MTSSIRVRLRMLHLPPFPFFAARPCCSGRDGMLVLEENARQWQWTLIHYLYHLAFTCSASSSSIARGAQHVLRYEMHLSLRDGEHIHSCRLNLDTDETKMQYHRQNFRLSTVLMNEHGRNKTMMANTIHVKALSSFHQSVNAADDCFLTFCSGISSGG